MQSRPYGNRRPTRPWRHLTAALSALLMIVSGLVTINAAQADSVQVESYQRASQSEQCSAQPWQTPWQASWGPDASWGPSWEQWANAGSGGWTCTRQIVWARSTTYGIGDVGPGGGLVFLLAGGLTYEMAPKAWGTAGAVDPAMAWCSDTTNSVPTSTAIGAGRANTSAMLTSAAPFTACTSGAGYSASTYRGGGLSDWFLPSKDELNALYGYTQGMPSSQQATYGFAAGFYWSSSQSTIVASDAWLQYFADGTPTAVPKLGSYQVRPIRSF